MPSSCARVDLARSHPGIHVTLVMPGLVTTEFGRHALGGSPSPASTEAQSAEEVADAIAGVLEHPAAEIYTNPRQRAIGLKYFEDVGAFEREAARR